MPDGKRILVVEDHAINREILSAMLSVLGHRATVVDNGEAALVLLGSEPFDLVLMDWAMPGLDGLETTRRLRLREAGGARLPVVIVSASALDQQVAACIEAGADGHLAKPFRLADLTAVLARWLPPG